MELSLSYGRMFLVLQSPITVLLLQFIFSLSILKHRGCSVHQGKPGHCVHHLFRVVLSVHIALGTQVGVP